MLKKNTQSYTRYGTGINSPTAADLKRIGFFVPGCFFIGA